jgi:hypothetical protein
MPTESTSMLVLLVTIRGQKKSFQDHTVVNRAKATTADHDSGRKICL